MIFFMAMPFVVGLMNFAVPLQLGMRARATSWRSRSALLVVLLVIAGSLWIMANLTANMMPGPELMDIHMQR